MTLINLTFVALFIKNQTGHLTRPRQSTFRLARRHVSVRIYECEPPSPSVRDSVMRCFYRLYHRAALGGLFLHYRPFWKMILTVRLFRWPLSTFGYFHCRDVSVDDGDDDRVFLFWPLFGPRYGPYCQELRRYSQRQDRDALAVHLTTTRARA